MSNIGPLRWMAPESIAQQTYSKLSDVWTFGIVGRLRFYPHIKREKLIPQKEMFIKFIVISNQSSVWNCCSMWASCYCESRRSWHIDSVSLKKIIVMYQIIRTQRLPFSILLYTTRQHLIDIRNSSNNNIIHCG
jgi:serine/threonine protein kinase